MTSWAMSPTYGSVVLGPVQAAVLAQAHALTGGGRRPYVTLGRLAMLTGRPTSSVHEALGRLRALGLVGVAARTGRRGGHRLWRPPSRRGGGPSLDIGRHRRAIARMLGASRALSIHRTPVPEAGTLGLTDEPASPPDDPGVRPPLDPDRREGDPGSFREQLARHGFTPWWPQDDAS